MSTGERTRPEDVGTDSSIDANDEYHGADATRVLERAATDELAGRRLRAKLLPYGDPCRDHVVPFAGVIVGRDSDGRVRIRAGGAIRFAKPSRLKDVQLGAQVDRGDGPIPDGGQRADDADRFAYACFGGCGAKFNSLDAMVPVAGEGDRGPRHFCESCAEQVRSDTRFMTDGGAVEVPADHADRVLVDDSEPGQLTAAIQEGNVHAVLAFPTDARQDDLDDAFAELLKEAHYIRELQGGDRP